MAKLFTVGPVEMYGSTLKISGEQLPYFRTPEFSEMMLDSERMLKELLHADDGSRTVFLTSSGTGAMEATVINCFTVSDKLLIISGGGFGKRFEEICRVHQIPFDAIDLPFGETLTEKQLKPYEEKDYTGLLVNIDETTTGQLYSLDLLSSFCRKKNMLLVVDAISSFLADNIDMKENGIDAIIISSQKALALSPGLSIVVISDRMSKRIQDIDSHSLYFDFKTHIRDQERGQTPFTPAVGTLIELNDMLKNVCSIGIEKKIGSTRTVAEDFRKKAKSIGLTIPDYPLSNAVTPILFPDGNATKVYEKLKTMDIIVTPSGGDKKNIMLRVGHIGNVTTADNDLLIESLTKVIR